MLGGKTVREIYELKGKGRSIRGIADDLGISRVTVRKYLRSEGVPKSKPREKRGSKLDAYKEYIDVRLAEGLENCVVLLREIRELGYEGGYTTLKDYVHPRRRPRQPKATVRFETGPGEQAQVDWGVVSYKGEDGRKHRMWAFVMVLGFSRAIYAEFVRRADVPTFIRCHLNAFDYFGGVPRRCLYDNAKVVVLERDDEDGDHEWNSRMLDLARRVGFELRLCKPYRAQTKGKVESGVKYVKGNFWPSARFTDDADLNRQALAWCGEIANERVHGTTGKVPKAMLGAERSSLGALPERSTLSVYLREERKVGRDGYVNWDGSRYGVPWSWSGNTVQVGMTAGMVEIWSGNERLAVHPRAHRRGQRLTLPGQWDGLVSGETRPKREALAVQVSAQQVERRSLDIYELIAGGGVR